MMTKCNKLCVNSVRTAIFSEIDKLERTEYHCPIDCEYRKIVVDFLGRSHILNDMKQAPEGIPILVYLSREMNGSIWQIMIVDDITRIHENPDWVPDFLGWISLPTVH